MYLVVHTRTRRHARRRALVVVVGRNRALLLRLHIHFLRLRLRLRQLLRLLLFRRVILAQTHTANRLRLLLLHHVRPHARQ